MYLDIIYPLLLRTNFWAKNLQWTPATTYIQSIMCRQSSRHFDAIGMSPGVEMGVLITSNCC